MRSRVDFPAPFAPTRASTSLAFTSRETPRKAGTVGFAIGCNSARHPLVTGGKYFSKFSTLTAGLPTASGYIVTGPTEQGLSACAWNVTVAGGLRSSKRGVCALDQTRVTRAACPGAAFYRSRQTGSFRPARQTFPDLLTRVMHVHFRGAIGSI